MPVIAIVKEGCGTLFVESNQEFERHKAMGWKERPANWKDAQKVEDAARRKEAIAAARAQLDADEKEIAEIEKKAASKRVVGADTDGDGKIDKVFAEPKKKLGRKPKAK